MRFSFTLTVALQIGASDSRKGAIAMQEPKPQKPTPQKVERHDHESTEDDFARAIGNVLGESDAPYEDDAGLPDGDDPSEQPGRRHQ